MARYLITGGAGFLGINLVRFLLARGEEVTSLDIVPFRYPDVSNRVRIVAGDIRNAPDLERAMDGVDVVVHAAAALPLYSEDEIRTTDVDGTRNVLEAAERHGVDRVIHVSSTAVYGIPEHHPIFEDDSLVGVGPYGEAKIAAEELCLQYRGKGMCVAVLRPKSFVGPERLGVFALFYDWAFSGKNFPILGSGQNRYQLLDVEDLCEAIYLASTASREVANDTFNIGAREFTTIGEDYQAVMDFAGHGKRIIPIPLVKPAVLTLRLLERFDLSPLYKWVYETVFKDSFVSIDKAQRKLGYQPQFSNKDALVRNYRWYAAHRYEFEHASGVSHRVPWKQGILRYAKALF